MSTVTINSVNQGFLMNAQSINPSGGHNVMKLSRRGRLARTVVVLSLSVVMAAGFASQIFPAHADMPGAGQKVASTAPSYTVVVVAPGETLWSVAAAYASGDVQGMVNDIREANNLKGFDLQAGQKLRVPVK
jgi:hypothetical protein